MTFRVEDALSTSDSSFPMPCRAGFVTCSETISDLHRSYKNGIKSPLLSAASALPYHPNPACSNASLLIPVYDYFLKYLGINCRHGVPLLLNTSVCIS